MHLTVNGEDRSFNGLVTVMDLVERLQLDPRKVALELDLEIVPRSLYGQTRLRDGARVEIVHFIGGG